MSQFFDLASLVLVPSGYKSQKIYAQKPLSADGELTFTRSNDTATRVGSDGLIEKVRTNLVKYSQDFSNAYWTKPQATLVSGQTAPNGTSDAFKLVEDTSTNYHWLLQGSVSPIAGEWGVSIFAKPAGRNYIVIGNASNSHYAYFDLQNGTIVSNHANAVPTIEAAENGFYRCSVVLTTPGSSAVGFFISTNGSTINYTGDGTSGLYLFGAQVEKGVPTDYIATTTAAVSVGPVANLPRLDYSGGATCPKLLLEPQRVNLALWSESFYNAAWSGSGSVVANTAISPSGYQDADTGDNIYTSTGVGDATTLHANSIFAKANPSGSSILLLRVNRYGSGVDYNECTFNLSNGTASAVTTGGTASSASAEIEDYGNGWYRCILTGIASTTAGVISFNPQNNCFIWGAQIEAGAYATSYINTTSAASTRGAERALKTGISSLIGGTSGTVFFEIKTNKTLTSSGYKQFFYYADAASAQAYMYLNGSNYLLTNLNLGSITGGLQFQADTTYKVAIAYASSDFKLYVNGVEDGSSTSGTPINANQIIAIGSYSGTSEFNEMAFAQYIHFPTRLTNAQLAELTSL